MAERTLDISIPHRLGRAEARRRIATGVARLQSDYAGQFAQIEQKWTGDRFEFAITALGQRASGWVDVADDAAHIHVLLPWLLARLADQLRPRIEGEARRVLSFPPGEQ